MYIHTYTRSLCIHICLYNMCINYLGQNKRLKLWERKPGGLRVGVGVRLPAYFLVLYEFFNHMYVLSFF